MFGRFSSVDGAHCVLRAVHVFDQNCETGRGFVRRLHNPVQVHVSDEHSLVYRVTHLCVSLFLRVPVFAGGGVSTVEEREGAINPQCA